jgi:hypothetical protein
VAVTRGAALLHVAVYAAIVGAAGVFWGLTAAIVVGFLSVLVLLVGFAALYGGDWFRDASKGRFHRPPERR